MSRISDYHQRLGGDGGPLGATLGPESAEPWGGFSQAFQKGRIFFHDETGPHAMAGAALNAFLAAGGVEALGYPLEDTATVAGGQAAFAERGCVWTGPAGTFRCRLAFPLIGRPAMVDPAAPRLGVSVRSEPASIPPDLFALLWRDRLSLLPVVSRAVEVALAPQGLDGEGKAEFGLAAGATLAQDRQLYNLAFRRADGNRIIVAPHAFYVKASWKEFGLIHATDIHVSRRLETYRQKLLDMGQPEGALAFECANDRLRDMIRAANALHAAGSLDLILMTGDLVDFEFEKGDRADGLGNYGLLRDILLGRDASSDPTVAIEELKVPVFTILGNHDYRRNPYKLLFDVEIAGKDVMGMAQYENHNLIEEEAFALQGRSQPSQSPSEAIDMITVDSVQKAYGRIFNDERSYVVALGRNRIVMLDTRWDAGLPRMILFDDTGLFSANAWHGFDRDDIKQIFTGSPNVRGPLAKDVEKLKGALDDKDAQGGLVIVGVHGPPIDIAGAEYPWFFRETLRDRPEVLAETVAFLQRNDPSPHPESVALAHPNWFPKQASKPFKKGGLEDLVDAGVSRGQTEEFMMACAGKGTARPADIVLCGHGHKHTEYRVRWDEKDGFLLHMDFYSENPPRFYNTRSRNGESIYVDVAPGGDMVPVKKAWEPDFAEYWKMATPPYATPLSGTANSQQARAWWDDHRPIIMQSSSLGLVESRQRMIFLEDSQPTKPPPTFQGYRVFTIQDDTITRIHHIGQAPGRQLRSWGSRTVARLAEIRGGAVSEVRLLQLKDGRLLTVVRAGDGQLKLITWSAKLGSKDNGAFARTGEAEAGKATNLNAVQAGPFVVTSCQNDKGELLLIPWQVDSNGAVKRAAQSSAQAGKAEMIQIVALADDLLVTACQNDAGNLLLISWRLGADGTIKRLGEASAGKISALAFVSPRAGVVVTAVRAGNDRLLLISWSVSSRGAIRRLGDSAEQAGEIESSSGIGACVDRLGRVATSVRANKRLKVILWEVNANGAFIRRGDNAGQTGVIGQQTLTTVATTTDRSVLVSAVLTEAGTLKLITFDVTPEGAVRRIPQTGGEAGQASHLAVVAGPLAGGIPALGGGGSFPIVTALRAANGELLLISWRAAAPGAKLNLPGGASSPGGVVVPKQPSVGSTPAPPKPPPRVGRPFRPKPSK